MRTFKCLLIATAMVSVLAVSAQGIAQQPEVQMQSTSIMIGSGSTLPSAATEGVFTTNTTEQNPAQMPNGPRRARPGDWTDPYKDPIGDAVWLLILAAAVYGVYKRKLRVR